MRDENSGELWSPTCLPAGAAPCRVRHGQGYTVFEQNSHGIQHELLEFVPLHDPIKLVCLKLKNTGRRPRRLSATFYAEWVLGTVREQTAMHVNTDAGYGERCRTGTQSVQLDICRARRLRRRQSSAALVYHGPH